MKRLLPLTALAALAASACSPEPVGFFLMQAGRHDEAAEKLELALAAGIERANTHYDLGVCRERRGRRAEALEHYRRALALDPGHAGAARDVSRLTGTR